MGVLFEIMNMERCYLSQPKIIVPFVIGSIYLYFVKEYPLKSDLVEKWSDVEGLWDYALNSLMCIQDNPDFPVLISQPALNPKKNADKIAEVNGI